MAANKNVCLRWPRGARDSINAALLCSLYLEQTYSRRSGFKCQNSRNGYNEMRGGCCSCDVVDAFSLFLLLRLYQKHNKAQPFSFLLMRNDNSLSGKQNKLPLPPPSAAAAVCIHVTNKMRPVIFFLSTTQQ